MVLMTSEAIVEHNVLLDMVVTTMLLIYANRVVKSVTYVKMKIKITA